MNEDKMELMSYVSEIREIQKILREIPPQNVIERATFQSRLSTVLKEYRDKYSPCDSIQEALRVLNERDISFKSIVECCKICSNEKVACVCMEE